MGDWSTFDWRQLDTHTLVCILSGVWQELSSRLLARYPFPDTSGVHSVPSPSGSFTVIGDSRESSENVPLRIPFQCEFKCRWCDAQCTRREGHRYHSCFHCRHRR